MWDLMCQQGPVNVGFMSRSTIVSIGALRVNINWDMSNLVSEKVIISMPFTISVDYEYSLKVTTIPLISHIHVLQITICFYRLTNLILSN